MIDFKVIILAIFKDNDFPLKVMTEIHGKLMIQYAYDAAKDAGASQIIVATDSPRIGMVAEDFGATVCMLIDENISAISCLSEVVDRMEWDDETIVVNVPADAPLTPSAIINQVVENLVDKDDIELSALYSNVSRDVAGINQTINLVTDKNGYVLYLSRSLIPHDFSGSNSVTQYKNYIELNAYRVSTLKKYNHLLSSELDCAEGIEELKLLHNGMKIHAVEANSLIGQRVFTEQDVGKVQLQISPNK